jgi:hypothetical protein
MFGYKTGDEIRVSGHKVNKFRIYDTVADLMDRVDALECEKDAKTGPTPYFGPSLLITEEGECRLLGSGPSYVEKSAYDEVKSRLIKEQAKCQILHKKLIESDGNNLELKLKVQALENHIKQSREDGPGYYTIVT